jgi:SAM-dependent methyltransferase
MTTPPSARSPIWHHDQSRRINCPVCGFDGEAALLLDIDSLVPPHPRLSYATCPQCKGIIQLDFDPPSYASDGVLPEALKFYIEQGAALDILVLPAFIARTRNIQSYLEVGCGFGFGLDFAQKTFGWKVCGIDPSSIAAEGRRLLKVPIESRYLDYGDSLGGKTYSTIAVLEVLEHMQRPLDLLRLLKSHLTPQGLLVLSTPDANYIEFGREPPGFIAVLTPGYHAVLFAASTLDRCLRMAGFDDIQIKARGVTLLAVAGPGASAIDFDKAFNADAYRSYLEKRLAVESEPMLATGFGYRLFKHLVNRGLYADAEPVLRQLRERVIGRYDIDVLEPHDLLARFAHEISFEQFVEQLPTCIVGIFYFTAMLRLNQHEDRSGAVMFFYAAHTMAGVFRRAMFHYGVDDLETADLERSAREHARLVLGWMIGVT